MPKDTLLLLAVMLLAFVIYWPIMRLARQDMAHRSQQGLSNTTILVLLLLPIVGPLLYLLFRSSLKG